MWVPVVIDQRVSRCWNTIRADRHLAAPFTTHCVNCTSAVSRPRPQTSRREGNVSETIRFGHQHALARHRGFHGGNAFVQPVPDLKLILGYSSQVGHSGFAIFAELQGSERRSLSLRRPHNLATGVSLARVSVVT